MSKRNGFKIHQTFIDYCDTVSYCMIISCSAFQFAEKRRSCCANITEITSDVSTYK